MAGELADPVMQPAPTRLVADGYDRLMSLTLRHEFYGGDLCADFDISPTVPTQALLSQFGLLWRPLPGGIVVLYQTRRSEALVRYLLDERKSRKEAQNAPSGDKHTTFTGAWTRLTFTLTLKNDLFSNFTAIPFAMPGDMKPGDYALYISNRYVKEPLRNPAQLNSDWNLHWRSLPAVIFSPQHLHIPTPHDALEFVLYDTSGRAILSADRYFSPDSATDTVSEALKRARLTPNVDMHISMAGERPGLFSYEFKKAGGRGESTEFFYSGMRDAPLLFVDLFLASPETARDAPTVGGYYPVSLPDEVLNPAIRAAAGSGAKSTSAATGGSIKPYDYEFVFDARKTIWIYYIVLPSREVAAKDLAIVADPPATVEFGVPQPVTLPTGAAAYRFIANSALPLRRRSEIRLRLLAGAAQTNGSRRTLLERLPTPSAERITAYPAGPLTDDTAASEIFVYL